jgi:hypothetical protein
MNIAVSGEGSPDTKRSMLINGAMQAHHVHLGYIAIFTVLKFWNFTFSKPWYIFGQTYSPRYTWFSFH